jgi:hypothetical protein
VASRKACHPPDSVFVRPADGTTRFIRVPCAVWLASLSIACVPNPDRTHARVGNDPRASATLRVVSDGVRLDLKTGVPIDPGTDRPPSTHVRAVRDEVLSWQLVVRAQPGEYPISVKSDALDVRLFREVPIEVKESSRSSRVRSLGTGVYPDPLIETSTISMAPGQTFAVLWIDLWVPRQAQVGLHDVEIQVARLGKVSFRVDVLGRSLPERDVARLGAVNFGSILARKDNQPEAFRRILQLFHAHGVTVELMRWRPAIDAAGVIQWTEWREEIRPYLSGELFTPRRGYRGPWEGVEPSRMLIPLTDWWPDPAKDRYPSNPERWQAALRQWENTVKQVGGFDKTLWFLFVNSLDEPKTEGDLKSLRSYETLIDRAGLERRSRVWFRVDGPFGARRLGWSSDQVATYLDPVVDLWNLHGASDTLDWPTLPLYKRTHGGKWMVYASGTSGEPTVPPVVLDAPLAGARTWGWLVAKHRLEGMINWEVEGDTARCLLREACEDWNGLNLDDTLFYAGNVLPELGEDVAPSIRLKMLRRGAQDAALLAMLEVERPELRHRLLETLLPDTSDSRAWRQRLGTWPRSTEAYDRARAFMVDILAREGNANQIAGIREEPMADTPFRAIGMGWVVLAGLFLGFWRLLVRTGR